MLALQQAQSLVQLDWTDLALVSACLLINVGLSLRFRLGLHKSLVIAGLRTILQLWLVGLILDKIFQVDQPFLVLGILILMAILAASTVSQRARHSFPGRWITAMGSISFPAFLMVAYGVFIVVRPDNWADPRYLIPLMGMILGNSLTAVHLTMDRFTSALVERRKIIEHRLCLGATPREATQEVTRDAIRTGMTPILNAMVIVGIVSLPGMMTGQILGGTPPLMAVRYQIVIMFLLAGTTALGSAVCALWLRRRLFDGRYRIVSGLK